MNGKLLAAAAFAAVSVGAAFAVEPPEADAPVVGEACLQSPDGRTKCSFALKDGHSRVAFSYDGKSVGEASFEPGLDAEYEIIGTSERVVRSSWTPRWGTQSVYPENYRELTVRLTCPKQNGRETLRIELRVYDEGVAMRYVVTPNVYSENAIEREWYAVSFPAGSVAWPIPSTEATYPEEPMDVAGLDAGRSWRMPLTVRTSSGVYASILEANTVDWPRSYLVADGKGGFTSRFAHGAKCGRGEWVSPWRAILLAPSAGGLIERSYLVQNLNAPCSIERTDWIRPGLSVSDLGNCEFETDEVIAAAKAAKKVGAKYLQLDWGWYGTEYRWSDADREHFRKMTPKLADDPTWVENSYADPFTVAKGTVPYHPFWDFSSLTRFNVELDIRKIVGELRKLDMGLCLYVHGNVLENTDLDRLFATYESWGVAGLKPGFVAYGSQAATEWLRKLAETAAKHHLWLDVHDEHIPDGFERTWPNVMITEGGGGAEGGHPVHQDVALPFGRCLAGPFDYTPEFFNPKRTHAHAAAFLVCYPGPTAVMRGNLVKMMAAEPTYPEFVGALPWTYDETRVLAGEISKYLVVARRKGDTWYLGGMNGSSARTVRVSAGFLKTATTFRLWTDSGERKITVEPKEFIEIEMSAGGGFIGMSLPDGETERVTAKDFDRDFTTGTAGKVSSAACGVQSAAVEKSAMQAAVQKILDDAVKSGAQSACQCCVYINGKLVVDAWAGTMATNSAEKIDGSTLFPIFSTEKAQFVTAAHIAHERGKFDYEAKIRDYWPEFKGGNKDELTVRQLLGMRTGLPGSAPREFTDAQQCDWKFMTDWAMKSEAKHPGQSGYLGITWGWYLGKVVENVYGRPLNDVLTDEVLKPCGIEKDYYFAVPDSELKRVVTVYNGKENYGFEQMNKDCFRKACIPSAYAVANARAIAKFYLRLSGQDGKAPLIKRETLMNALKVNRADDDPLPDAETLRKNWQTVWGLGYTMWGERDELDRIMGSGGLGGSEGFCDLKNRICIGYTCAVSATATGKPWDIRPDIYRVVGIRTRYVK